MALLKDKLLKCFVASAFDYEDVDSIFDNAIKPVAKELGIKLYRVDRVEHNEDIDDQLLRLMETSDLCIADLTYARPSVYFEAGFMTSQDKPVVYLVRNDHFRPKNDDKAGNFRVHFDLQMKNIIPWSAPTQTFRKKLISRLKHVSAPLKRKKEQMTQENDEINSFKALSSNEKSDLVRKIALSALKKHQYTLPIDSVPFYYEATEEVKGVIGIKFIKNVLSVLIVVPSRTFRKKMLSTFNSDFLLYRINHQKFSSRHNLKKGIKRMIHVVLCSFDNLPYTRLEDAISSYCKHIPDEKRVIVKTWDITSKWKHNFFDIRVIDSIKSKSQFVENLNNILSRVRETDIRFSEGYIQ